MGVNVSDTNTEIKIATMIVTENSCTIRPTMPPRNKTGMKTATNERVIERIVKPISLDARIVASTRPLPISRWRTMFSSITIASSTTNPTESVRSEEHTSELQSRFDLVCRLLLEKKKKNSMNTRL